MASFNAADSSDIITRVANSSLSRSQILEALDLLEKSLAYKSDSAVGLDLNEQAAKKLRAFVEGARGSKQPMAHYLLANAYKNQAQYYHVKGDAKKMQQFAQLVNRHLRVANRNRSLAKDNWIEKEIDADYNLLVRKDYAQAVKLYTELASAKNTSPLHLALRAKWMLLGIYGGDWNAPKSVQDKTKERALVREILALWPESAEAKFLQAQIRFQQGESRIAFRPLANSKVATTIPQTDENGGTE